MLEFGSIDPEMSSHFVSVPDSPKKMISHENKLSRQHAFRIDSSTPASHPIFTFREPIPESVSDQDSYLLAVLLASQEEQYGFNMMDALTSDDLMNVQDLISTTGCTENEAKRAVFEKRFQPRAIPSQLSIIHPDNTASSSNGPIVRSSRHSTNPHDAMESQRLSMDSFSTYESGFYSGPLQRSGAFYSPRDSLRSVQSFTPPPVYHRDAPRRSQSSYGSQDNWQQQSHLGYAHAHHQGHNGSFYSNGHNQSIQSQHRQMAAYRSPVPAPHLPRPPSSQNMSASHEVERQKQILQLIQLEQAQRQADMQDQLQNWERHHSPHAQRPSPPQQIHTQQQIHRGPSEWELQYQQTNRQMWEDRQTQQRAHVAPVASPPVQQHAPLAHTQSQWQFTHVPRSQSQSQSQASPQQLQGKESFSAWNTTTSHIGVTEQSHQTEQRALQRAFSGLDEMVSAVSLSPLTNSASHSHSHSHSTSQEIELWEELPVDASPVRRTHAQVRVDEDEWEQIPPELLMSTTTTNSEAPKSPLGDRLQDALTRARSSPHNKVYAHQLYV
eukprot:gene24530-30886_t